MYSYISITIKQNEIYNIRITRERGRTSRSLFAGVLAKGTMICFGSFSNILQFRFSRRSGHSETYVPVFFYCDRTHGRRAPIQAVEYFAIKVVRFL